MAQTPRPHLKPLRSGLCAYYDPLRPRAEADALSRTAIIGNHEILRTRGNYDLDRTACALCRAINRSDVHGRIAG